jgi:hypothetical protein
VHVALMFFFGGAVVTYAYSEGEDYGQRTNI